MPWPLSLLCPATDQSDPIAGDPKYYEKQNLELQRRMTDAAEKQADAATRQLEWLNPPTVILFLTLLFTAAAAIAAAISARAARQSLESLLRIERAYVFGYPVKSNFPAAVLPNLGALGGLPDPCVKIEYANWGKTPALIVEIRQGLTHATRPPDRDGYMNFDPIAIRETVYAGSTQHPADVTYQAPQPRLTAGDLDEIQKNTRWFFVQCRVLYRPVTDKPDVTPRRMTLCWRYEYDARVASGAWVEFGGPAYNER